MWIVDTSLERQCNPSTGLVFPNYLVETDRPMFGDNFRYDTWWPGHHCDWWYLNCARHIGWNQTDLMDLLQTDFNVQHSHHSDDLWYISCGAQSNWFEWCGNVGMTVHSKAPRWGRRGEEHLCSRYIVSYPSFTLFTFHYLAFVSQDSFLYLSVVVTCDNPSSSIFQTTTIYTLHQE